MSSFANNRLKVDLNRIQKDPPTGVSAAPMNDDIMLWEAVILGPDDTPFEEGMFKIVLQFPKKYPLIAPNVHFATRIFHPNVYEDGAICLDVLQSCWSPVYDVSTILSSIRYLLNDPDLSYPVNESAAKLYRENRTEYNKKVRECVKESLLPADTE